MPYDPKIHHRRSIRLKGYDYTQPGAYSVTMVTQDRESLFGEISDGTMHLNAVGNTIQDVWSRLPAFFPISLDEWVIMPNHLHGIIMILDGVGAKHPATKIITGQNIDRRMLRPNDHLLLQQAPIGTAPGSLGAIIQNFKSISTRKINQLRGMPGVPVWQRDYYEHIMRDEAELNRFRLYIQVNPSRWMDDDEYISM